MRTFLAPDSWTLELAVPEALILALYGVGFDGVRSFRGNFQACGDKTPAPYYAAWSPIGTESPDFHRPEYFGELLLT